MTTTSTQPIFVPASTKRHRTSSHSSESISPETSRNSVPPSKSTRISASPPPDSSQANSDTTNQTTTSHPLICSLPPTCNRRPTPLANSKELESHYAKYHAHVCEQPGCGCVFPEAKLLELHQTENHDPLAALRKERGEKIASAFLCSPWRFPLTTLTPQFACHLPSCTSKFATPKGRRLHLITAHGYPKEYFFAVTNKGVGGLLKKWGEGASLIRGHWKARDDTDADPPPDGASQPGIKRKTTKRNSTKDSMQVDTHTYRDRDAESMDVDNSDDSDNDSDSEDQDQEQSESHQQQQQPRSQPPLRKPTVQAAFDPEATPRRPAHPSLPPTNVSPTKTSPSATSGTALGSADALASSFSSLSLVPPSVRFGRGGKNAGFASYARNTSSSHPHSTSNTTPQPPREPDPADPSDSSTNESMDLDQDKDQEEDDTSTIAATSPTPGTHKNQRSPPRARPQRGGVIVRGGGRGGRGGGRIVPDGASTRGKAAARAVSAGLAASAVANPGAGEGAGGGASSERGAARGRGRGAPRGGRGRGGRGGA
ncbi:hypothetical protein FA15DRAFT_731736 [Coprinopsis marcescibilis]|uniref:C2H2-type domain-containing protein n=1 Tax=Coprinopsis marcescibilis TaxID=230819 RepID=A0A5C3L9U4_COPMA|nr:hypothetical protein FA15DRAFT_731736 [Coprinopsis marcescibilis]